MLLRTSLLVSWLLMLLVGAALAEEPAAIASKETAAVDTPRYRLNPFDIIVTAPRQSIPLKDVPAATTVVGGDALKEMPRGVSVDEALKIVPGVRIDNNANGERVHLSIRGQGILVERGIRGIKLLLDGLPLNDPSGVAPDFYDVDWATVDRVEVLRGPAAALYGGGSAAGIVNMSTQSGIPEPVGATVSATGGSYGLFKTLGQMSGTVNDVSYRISASHLTSDGYREHTAALANNVSGKIGWNASPKIHFTQVISWTDYFEENAEGLNLAQVAANPRQANPDAFKFNEYYQTNRLTTGWLGHADVTAHQTLDFNGYFRYTKYKESVPSSVLHRHYYTPGATLQYNVRMGTQSLKNLVSVGSDVQWQTIDENRVQNLGDAAEGALLTNETMFQRGVGVFFLDRLELGKRWGFTGSVRYDNIRNELTDLFNSEAPHADVSGTKNFDKATGRLGIAFTPITQFNVYANWGQGFLPPGTEELANNPAALGGLNERIEAATSMGEELGARGLLFDKLTYDVSGFYLTTDHDFYRFRMRDRTLETFYRNIGSTKRYGLETQLTWRPIHSVFAQAAYTYSHFQYSDPATDTDPGTGNSYALKDHWLPNSPQHQTYASVDYEVLPRLTVGVNNEYQSDWQVDAQNSTTVKGFTLWGARVRFEWKLGALIGDISLTGRNLFDEKYMAFTEPDPDGNSYQPAPTHEIFGGISIRR